MSDPTREPASFLPLTALSFHVLLSLAEQDRHGYGIIRQVEERTDGMIVLRTGTLYTLLQRLMAEQLIAPASAPRGSSGAKTTRRDERRRFYSLTPLGRRVLEAEAQRLEALVFEARRSHVLRQPSRA